MKPTLSGGSSRSYLPWLLPLLALHGALLVWAAAGPLAGMRKEYAVAEFVWVTVGVFALGFAAVTRFGRYARGLAVFGTLMAAAMLLTPGAVLIVLLCLLSAHVLGVRLLRYVGAHAGGAAPAPGWPVPMLCGIAVWIGLIAATAAFRIHYAPYYTALLFIPLAVAWRDVADSIARVVRLARPAAAAPGPTERIWIALLLAVIALHLFIVARPEVGFDANAMHLQIAMLVNDAHRWRFDVNRYAWAVMPFGADWAYTVAYILAGENAARFANLCFGALACALVYALIIRHARREIAIASVCLLASTPLAFTETSTLYVENLWTAFLLGTVLVTLQIARGTVSTRIGWPALALLAAGAMQCKVIGVIWLAPVLAYALIITVKRSGWHRPAPRSTLVMSIAALIAAWPYANAWVRTGNPVFPFMNAWFRSPFADTTTSFTNPTYVLPLGPTTLYDIFIESHRYIEGGDGAAGFHWLLLIPLIALALTRNRPLEQWLCAGLATVFFIAVYMQQAYLRYLWPAFMLLAVLGGWALNTLPDRPFTRLAVLVVGGSLCLLQIRLMPTGSWHTEKLCVGCAFNPRDRVDLVALYMPDRLVADYLNRALPNARVGYLMLNAPSPAGYVGYSRAANWHDHSFYYPAIDATSADEIDALVRRFGLTHVVYRTAIPEMENAAIRAYRDTRTTPVWQFRDFVVAAVAAPP
jgi:hypothetical protein